MSQHTYLVVIPQELAVAPTRQRATPNVYLLSGDAMIGNEVLAQHGLLAIEVLLAGHVSGNDSLVLCCVQPQVANIHRPRWLVGRAHIDT